MNNAATLLDQLHEAGVSVTLDGSELVLVPGDRVPAELIPALREHKAEVMAHLCPKFYIEAQAAALLTCNVCGANHWWPRPDGKWDL